jgi:hypothetical protein
VLSQLTLVQIPVSINRCPQDTSLKRLYIHLLKRMTAPLFSLPQDILCFIANYLLPAPEQHKRIFHYSYDWRSFLNSNKKHFGRWKKESQILVLTGADAKRFRDLKGFREKASLCVENSRFQLDVILDGKEEVNRPVIDLQLFNNVRKIHLQYYHCVAPLTMDVDEISLADCRIQELFFCSNCKSVRVVQSAQALESIVLDFSLFQNIEKGIFRLNNWSSTSNHHLLGNLKSLVLCRSSAITDVSCFKNIPHLSLILCSGITDVSSLGKVYTLSLMGCKNIHDVSALGRVHTLDLSYCEKVTDLSALEWVYSLTFDGFKGSDLSGLRNIVVLNISYAAYVADITMLHSLQVLNIEGCKGISSWSGLSNLTELWILEREVRRTTSGGEGFPRVVSLHLIGSNSFSCRHFLPTLEHLQDLELRSCDWEDLSVISLIPGLHSLTISSFYGFTTLPRLPVSLSYLKISACRLESLTIARKQEAAFPLYDLIIEYCPDLNDLQIDERIFKCRISSCELLTTMVINEQIGHLRIQKVDALEKIVHWSKVVSPVLLFSQERVLTVEPGKDELLVG